MIRHDEKKWVAEILATHEKPQKMTVYQLIRYIAMYHYDDWCDLKLGQYVKNVLNTMREFNFTVQVYEEWKCENYVKRFCKRILDGRVRHELLDIETVSVTQKEMEIVKSAATEKQQMLMFTFYVMAKVSIAPSGWVNYDLAKVFALANLKMTKVQRHQMIHDLYVQKLIRLNEFPDKRGYKVELQDDGEIAITITTFENIGKQYLEYIRDGWRMCDVCKRMIKIKAPNQKYCKRCAANQQKEQITQWRLENSENVRETA